MLLTTTIGNELAQPTAVTQSTPGGYTCPAGQIWSIIKKACVNKIDLTPNMTGPLEKNEWCLKQGWGIWLPNQQKCSKQPDGATPPPGPGDDGGGTPTGPFPCEIGKHWTLNGCVDDKLGRPVWDTLKCAAIGKKYDSFADVCIDKDQPISEDCLPPKILDGFGRCVDPDPVSCKTRGQKYDLQSGGCVDDPLEGPLDKNRECIEKNCEGFSLQTQSCYGCANPDDEDPNRYYGSEAGCVARGGEWVKTSMPGFPPRGYCAGGDFGLPDQGATWNQTIGQFGGMPTLDEASLNVPQAQGNIPYIQPGAYTQEFQKMLATPAFGGQTLEELENARIQAMRQDLGDTYGTMSDELTRRLNQEAAGAGMFTSGSRVQSLGQGLTDLQKRRMIEEAKGAAEIRGQRPQLLLQERQQRAEIANLWGQMDLNAQTQNLDSFLKGRLMEYDRLFKNGQMKLDAFQNNINMMGLFLDWQVSNAKTDIERAQTKAQIDNLYNNMDLSQRSNFMSFISNLAGQFAGGFGK